jgi:hypothetical protein
MDNRNLNKNEKSSPQDRAVKNPEEWTTGTEQLSGIQQTIANTSSASSDRLDDGQQEQEANDENNP